MKVKVSNHRSGSIDYVSQALKLSIPGYTKEMLVELPAETSERWIQQLEKDGLEVKKVSSTPAPSTTASSTPKSSTTADSSNKSTTTAPKTEPTVEKKSTEPSPISKTAKK